MLLVSYLKHDYFLFLFLIRTASAWSVAKIYSVYMQQTAAKTYRPGEPVFPASTHGISGWAIIYEPEEAGLNKARSLHSFSWTSLRHSQTWRILSPPTLYLTLDSGPHRGTRSWLTPEFFILGITNNDPGQKNHGSSKYAIPSATGPKNDGMRYPELG